MSEKYDGNLALIVDREIGGDFLEQIDKNGLLLWGRASGEIMRPFPSSVLEYFHALKWTRDLMNRRNPVTGEKEVPDIIKTYHARSRTREREKLVAMGIDEEVLDILANGRIKLAVALDTPGGLIHITKKITNMMHYVRSNAGMVVSLGSNEVMSGGAEILMEADRNWAHISPYTEVMFHISDIAAESPSGERKEAIAGIGEYLVDKFGIDESEYPFKTGPLGAEYRHALRRARLRLKLIKKALKESAGKRPDAAVGFEANELREKRAFHDIIEVVDNLREVFEETSLIHAGDYAGTALDRFFLNDEERLQRMGIE